MMESSPFLSDVNPVADIDMLYINQGYEYIYTQNIYTHYLND